jgi:hypothetical protein
MSHPHSAYITWDVYAATCFGTAERVTSLIALLKLKNTTHDKGFRTNERY